MVNEVFPSTFIHSSTHPSIHPIERAHRDRDMYLRTTGLFNPSVYFRTPLISYIHAPILKPFGVVIAISGRFNMVYHEP